ncbi:hen1 methyltransferase isoform 3-T3 [Cochliomyia hominivorax]
MRLLPLLRRIPHVEHILEVDIDGELLIQHQQKAIPLISDYLQKRERPLRVEVLQGSITDPVEQLYDVDAVIALEIIEHLHKDVLDKVPENIFDFIQPKVAIFSTPNSEFNILFEPLQENGFRHYDHKFEWSRKEFQTWCHDICKTYTNYSVAFMGVGKPLAQHKKLGYSTQIAIFARNDMLDKPLNYEVIKRKPISHDKQYKVIYAKDYPHNEDTRSKEQKILDETNYYLNEAKTVTKYYNLERCIYQIPWHYLMSFTQSLGSTQSELLEILKKNNFQIEGDFIILPEYNEDDNDDYESDVDYDGEYNLESKPYKHKLHEDEEDELSSNLASGCSVTAGKVNYDTEEDWD